MSGDTTQADTKWPNYALPRGTVVNGYRIERVLGSGGFGVTYLARDLLQQPFAIKEYYPRQFAIRQDLNVLAASADDEPLFEDCRERFLREAQALVVLSRVAGAGDGIVRVQTYFEAHGTCFLVMDYVEGASLASVLRQEPGGLAAGRVRRLLLQLLSAIGVVHRAGLMHRDIKPANIILRDDDRVVLIDFGSSREATSGQTTAYTQIYSGGYAPPEQMLGLRQGAFSDIYAIGAVCYQAIGGTVMDALGRQIAASAGRPDPQPSAAQVGAGRYPDALLRAIDAALATDAAQRPQTVEAMLEELGGDEPAGDATAGDATVRNATVVVARGRAPPAASQPQSRQSQPPQSQAREAHPQSQAPMVPQSRRSRRGAWGLAAGAGALVLLAVAYFALRGSPTPTSATPPQLVASTPAPAASPPDATQPAQRQGAPPALADDASKRATSTGRPSDAVPPIAPTPSAEPPKREAIVPTPSTPTPTPVASPSNAAPAIAAAPPSNVVPPIATAAPSDVAPPIAATPPPAAAPPQREAIVVPPPAPAPAPTPQASPSPLDRAKVVAQGLPCSVLHVASGQDGLRVSGLAPAGQDLDRMLAELRDLERARGSGRLGDDITRVDRFACAPLSTLREPVGSNWDNTPPGVILRLDQRQVASGARLEIDVDTTLPAIYIDLYQSDGSVRHLLRPASLGKVGKTHAEWIAASPPGPRLIAAIGSSTPLDLGARPETERAADYLAALEARLQHGTVLAFADLAMVTVHAAEPGVAPAVVKAPQPRPTNARSERCANIVSRAQLGETLTDAEIAALRGECRP